MQEVEASLMPTRVLSRATKSPTWFRDMAVEAEIDPSHMKKLNNS